MTLIHKRNTLNKLHKKQRGLFGGLFKFANQASKVLFVLGIGGLSSLEAVGLCFQGDEEHCLSGRFGVGVSYLNLDAPQAKAQSYGGFVNAEAIESYKRLQALLGIRFGLGGITYSGGTFDSLGREELALNTDVRIKLGVNILTKNIPLFVNIVLGDDYLGASSASGTTSKGFNRNLFYGGLELQGVAPVSSKGRIEYSAGFNAISGWYELGKTYGAKSGLKGFSYAINATLGYSQDIDERKEWYIKAIGKYENLAQSRAVPFYATYEGNPTPSSYRGVGANQNFGLMIEAGIGY